MIAYLSMVTGAFLQGSAVVLGIAATQDGRVGGRPVQT
jgi:hypothetical protein